MDLAEPVTTSCHHWWVGKQRAGGLLVKRPSGAKRRRRVHDLLGEPPVESTSIRMAGHLRASLAWQHRRRAPVAMSSDDAPSRQYGPFATEHARIHHAPVGS